MQSAIDGVSLRELKIIATPGGPVLHMIRPDLPWFTAFGEIYFSEVETGAVKAWKCHSKQTQRFAVPTGRLKIVLYDEREGSPSCGRLEEHILGRPEAYHLLIIPPGVWYGFTPASQAPTLICNCPDVPHDPAEGLRRPLDDPNIPYHW